MQDLWNLSHFSYVRMKCQILQYLQLWYNCVSGLYLCAYLIYSATSFLVCAGILQVVPSQLRQWAGWRQWATWIPILLHKQLNNYSYRSNTIGNLGLSQRIPPEVRAVHRPEKWCYLYTCVQCWLTSGWRTRTCLEPDCSSVFSM